MIDKGLIANIKIDLSKIDKAIEQKRNEIAALESDAEHLRGTLAFYERRKNPNAPVLFPVEKKPTPNPEDSLIDQVRALFSEDGEFQAAGIISRLGVNKDKWNSVRGTINLLYRRGHLGRRPVPGKGNAFSYARPAYYNGLNIDYKTHESEKAT